MTDMLADGVSWAAAQRHNYMAHDVTYVRPARNERAQQQVTIRATSGPPRGMTVDASNMLVGVVEVDFLFRAVDLVLPDDGLTEPEDGDRIVDAGVTYAILPRGSAGNEPSWRRTMNGADIRVHTKQTGA